MGAVIHLHAQVAEAADLLRQAKHAIALTGAGISTPSGIPDFRTPTAGLWEQMKDPMEVASIYAFKRHPQSFYDWLYPLARLMIAAQPNAAHLALAHLEGRGRLKGIITQNIDLLHSKAGSRTVYEVHGHLREMTCISCFQVYNANMFLPEYMDTGLAPQCPGCHGILKPNIILFGEMLPMRVLSQAQMQTRLCDLMLVVGSSLEVAPVGDLPLLAKQSGAKVIMINLGETYLDDIADMVIRVDVVEALPRLAEYF